MWIGLALLGYILGVFFLIKFFQTVHRWDEEIEQLENATVRGLRKRTDLKTAA